MRDSEIVGVAAAFAVLIAITALEMLRWLPARGKFKFGLVFLAGAAIIGSLSLIGIPPWWFEGAWEGFGLAVTLLLSGFVAEREAGRTFGLPLLLGMGATLMVLNVVPHVT
jgi:hypothetical protein